MEERKKKTVWRCRIGRRMRKECHFSELNTEKLQTTNICNFNHILRDQKTSKLQHPQNLQNATGARNGRKKKPSSKSTNTKTKNLAIFRIEVGVGKDLSKELKSDPRVHKIFLLPEALSYNEKYNYLYTDNIELFLFCFVLFSVGRVSPELVDQNTKP